MYKALFYCLFNRKLEARLPSAPIFFLKSLNEYTLQGFQCQAVYARFAKIIFWRGGCRTSAPLPRLTR
jgi:hypothetical protein